MASSRFTSFRPFVKPLAAALAIAAAGCIGLAARGETTTSVSSQSCRYVNHEVDIGGSDWRYYRTLDCSTVTSTGTQDSSSSGGKIVEPAPLGPNERYATQQELQARIDHNAEIRSHSPQPREVSLCPAPSRWTSDGCQPGSYKPRFVPRPLAPPAAPDARIAAR